MRRGIGINGLDRRLNSLLCEMSQLRLFCWRGGSTARENQGVSIGNLSYSVESMNDIDECYQCRFNTFLIFLGLTCKIKEEDIHATGHSIAQA